MKLHPTDVFLWALLSLAEVILAFVILKKGAERRWPFLLAFALFDLLHTVLLASHVGDYRSYFYIYWYGQGVRSLLTLGWLWDVSRAFPELKYVPKRMGLILLWVGITITAGSVFLTALQHPNTTYPLINTVLLIRGCMTVLWMGCAAALLGSISFLGLGWALQAVNVAAGAVAVGVAGMIAATLTSSWPGQGHLIDKLQTCIEIAVFLSWIKALCYTPDAPLSDSALNVITNELYEEQPLV